MGLEVLLSRKRGSESKNEKIKNNRKKKNRKKIFPVNDRYNLGKFRLRSVFIIIKYRYVKLEYIFVLDPGLTCSTLSRFN